MMQRDSLVRLRVAVLFVSSVAALIGVSGLAPSTQTQDSEAGGKTNATELNSKNTHADIIFSSPKRYAVIADQEKDIKRLYVQGSLIFHEKHWTPVLRIERIEPYGVLIRDIKRDHKKVLPFGHSLPSLPHLTLVEGMALTEIHYEFKVVEKHPEREPTLKRIEERRAYLVKEVSTELPPVNRQLTLHTSAGTPAPPRASDGPISKIRITRVDRDTYDVEKESLRPLYDFASRSITNPKDGLARAISLVTTNTLELKTAIGDANVNQHGFTLTRLDEAEKLGLQVGDRITSINGQSVTSALSAWGIAATLLLENRGLTHLQVKLDREGTLITKTYRLR